MGRRSLKRRTAAEAPRRGLPEEGPWLVRIETSDTHEVTFEVHATSDALTRRIDEMYARGSAQPVISAMLLDDAPDAAPPWIRRETCEHCDDLDDLDADVLDGE